MLLTEIGLKCQGESKPVVIKVTEIFSLAVPFQGVRIISKVP